MAVRTVRGALVKARALIRQYGWVQGRSIKISQNNDQVVGFCATGALETAIVGMPKVGRSHHGYQTVEWAPTLNEVEGASEIFVEARDMLVKAISPAAPLYGVSVVGFNDNSDRTKDEVLAIFDKAIKATYKPA